LGKNLYANPWIVRIKEIILPLSHPHHMNTAILRAHDAEGVSSEHLVGGTSEHLVGRIRVATSVRKIVYSTNR
jgi:hypothetical protein